jgi:hypothetical protein
MTSHGKSIAAWLIAVHAVSVSCSLSEPEQPVITPPHKTIKLDASSFGIDMAITVPDSLAANVQMRWNKAFGRLEVNIGRSLELHFTEDGTTLADKLAELERSIFDVNIVMADEHEVLYSLSLPQLAPSYFHYFATWESAGRRISAESNPLVEMDLASATLLRKIVHLTRHTNANPLPSKPPV